MAVTAVRRGDASSWLWIILVFQPFGAIVYFFSHYLDMPSLRWAGARRVTREDIRQAQADTRRLDSAANWAHLASLRRMRREYREAAEAGRRAVERDALNVDAQHELGLALLGLGRYAEAAKALEVVVAKDRNHNEEHTSELQSRFGISYAVF